MISSTSKSKREFCVMNLLGFCVNFMIIKSMMIKSMHRDTFTMNQIPAIAAAGGYFAARVPDRATHEVLYKLLSSIFNVIPDSVQEIVM